MGYFRDQIENYAEEAKPLTDLTSKRYRTNIPWDQSHQNAFDALKLALKRATENPPHPVNFFLKCFWKWQHKTDVGLVLSPPSSSSCTCILLSTLLFPDLFAKYSLVALFLCGLVESIVAPVW